jgi:hypothetical protein
LFAIRWVGRMQTYRFVSFDPLLFSSYSFFFLFLTTSKRVVFRTVLQNIFALQVKCMILLYVNFVDRLYIPPKKTMTITLCYYSPNRAPSRARPSNIPSWTCLGSLRSGRLSRQWNEKRITWSARTGKRKRRGPPILHRACRCHTS